MAGVNVKSEIKPLMVNTLNVFWKMHKLHMILRRVAYGWRERQERDQAS